MLLTAERVLVNGEPQAGVALLIGEDGRISAVRRLESGERPDRVLAGRLLVPGLVNANARVWPRLVPFVAVAADVEAQEAAERLVLNRLDADGLRDVARLAFAEMLVEGVTTVAVMHELHHQPDGTPYDDPAELADAVVQGARDAGIRLSLVRSIRVGERKDATPASVCARSIDRSAEAAADDLLCMAQRLLSFGDMRLAWGLGAQSPAAVSLHGLIALKTRFAHAAFHLPIHGSEAELHGLGTNGRYGAIEAFAAANLVDSCTVLCGSAEVTEREGNWAALLGASTCLVPAGAGAAPTPRNLLRQLSVCLGSGLSRSLRAVVRELARQSMALDSVSALRGQRSNGQALFAALTEHGCQAVQIEAGRIAPNRWADLVSFDLNDPLLADADEPDLVARVVGAGRELLARDVMVGGQWVVEDGAHQGLQDAHAKVERAAARLCVN